MQEGVRVGRNDRPRQMRETGKKNMLMNERENLEQMRNPFQAEQHADLYSPSKRETKNQSTYLRPIKGECCAYYEKCRVRKKLSASWVY